MDKFAQRTPNPMAPHGDNTIGAYYKAKKAEEDKKKDEAMLRRMKDKRERAAFLQNKRQQNVDALNREIVKYERRVKPYMPPYVLDAMDR